MRFWCNSAVINYKYLGFILNELITYKVDDSVVADQRVECCNMY